MTPTRKYFGSKKREELNTFELDSVSSYKKRFSFWQSKQLDALTFSINLIFTIAIAIGGFLITDETGLFEKAIFSDYSVIRTSLFSLIVSVTIGVIGLVLRLNDLSSTKKIVRTRQRIFELNYDIKYEDYQPSNIAAEKVRLDNLIYRSKILGKATWIAFYIQILTFLLTIWILVLSI